MAIAVSFAGTESQGGQPTPSGSGHSVLDPRYRGSTMVNGPAGRPPLKLVILLIISAVGLGLFAVGVTGHTRWTLIVVGLLLLVASIPGLWRIQKARDRTLR
jgi:hypothetical protein